MEAKHFAEQKKRMRIMLIAVSVLFGSIFLYKVAGGLILKYAIAHQSNVITVSAATADYSSWQPQIKASGTLRATQGVNVTTSLAGMVQQIYFTPGAAVTAGTVLVQLNADAEIGHLQSLQAQTALAEVTYLRDKTLYESHNVSKQTLDTDFLNLQSLHGQVAEQAATVAKKTIRAPFSGRLGINNVDLGQYINVGDVIVMLQTLDPIFVDFFVPQQALSRLKEGLPVTVTTDTFPSKKFMGKITTINPGVDPTTRNVGVEATIPNSTFELAPGMFVSVTVDSGATQRYLTLPQTAITFNPYGNIVYIIRETDKDKKGKPILKVTQRFVRTGETRGDQITILHGLNKGDMVVTSGQLKLKNDSVVTIDNSIAPTDSATPVVPNEH